MHTYTRSNSDAKISHFNYFFKSNYLEEISQHPNTAGEEIFKRLSRGVSWSRSVYITIMLQKWGPRWNLRERMCECTVRIGLGSVEERSLSRLGEPSCCSSEQRRRREPMPATAAQCFGERLGNARQPLSTTSFLKTSQTQRERGGGGGLQCFGGDGDSCPACAEKEEEDSFQLLPR